VNTDVAIDFFQAGGEILVKELGDSPLSLVARDTFAFRAPGGDFFPGAPADDSPDQASAIGFMSSVTV